MKLERITLNGNYLAKNGKRFIPIGAHWVPAKAGLQWTKDWDPEDIKKDFIKMKDLGFNVVRFDLFWAWFEPHPGCYNPQACVQLDYLIELAHTYDIYLHPTFFIGGEVGEAFWDVPWRQGRHPHEDPEMLRLQTNHVSYFTKKYRGETAILAWDLTDEPPFWIVWGKTTDAMAVNWTRLLSWAIRRQDPDALLCVGTSMEDLDHGPFRPDTVAEEADFLSSHPYPIYTLDRFADPLLSERSSYCGSFQAALSRGAGRPLMIHEYGASSAQYDPERIGLYDRVLMYSGLANGVMGFMPWCFTDASPETCKRLPYLRAPHETQFGITAWDRKDRPAGREVRNFAKVLAALDLESVEPKKGDAALIVPFEWAKVHGDLGALGLNESNSIPYTSVQDVHRTPESDYEENLWLTGSLLSAYILAKRAGMQVDMPREQNDWMSYPVVILPSPLTATDRNLTHLHTDFWERAESYVQNGGVLYASFCADAAIPEMEKLFGARLADHEPVESVKITFLRDFGNLKKGQTLAYKIAEKPEHWPVTVCLEGGTVIAEDEKGRPALILNRLGKGMTLMCTYPIESYLAQTPAAFENPENVEISHLIYEALAKEAGITLSARSSCPSVEIGVLGSGKRGYLIAVNRSFNEKNATLDIGFGIKNLSVVGSASEQGTLTHKDGKWSLSIKGWDGIVLEWNI